MTPNIAYVQIQSPNWRGLRLWLPLFLLWIPVLILSPLILIVIFAVCYVGEVDAYRAIASFWAIVCGLPGTDIHVRTEGNTVRVKIL